MNEHSPLVSSIQAIVLEVVVSDLQVKSSHLDSLRNVKDSFPVESHNHSLGPMLYLLLDKIRQLQEQGRIISLSMAKTLSQLGLAMEETPMRNEAPPPSLAHFTSVPRYSNQFDHHFAPHVPAPTSAPTYSHVPTPSAPRPFEPVDAWINVSSDEEEEEKEEERREEKDSCPRLDDDEDNEPPVVDDGPPSACLSRKADQVPKIRMAETSCPFCDVQWPRGATPAVFSKHLRSEHVEVPGSFFRCSACPRGSVGYRNSRPIMKHLESSSCGGSIVFDHVSNAKESTSQMPTSCAFCDKTWPTPPLPSDLTHHLIEAHEDVPGTFFRCSRCPMRTRKSRYVMTHLTAMSCGGCVVFDHASEKPKKIAARKRSVIDHSDEDNFISTTKSPRNAILHDQNHMVMRSEREDVFEQVVDHGIYGGEQDDKTLVSFRLYGQS